MQMLRIGGLVPLSTIDYPDVLSAVVFCQGCPWRCSFCHNPELLSIKGKHNIEWTTIMSFLKRRVGLLDAVVFSGGEPTMQDNLGDAMRQVIDLGYKVGLHTAGYAPEKLAKVLHLVDWIGFDIKAPIEGYRAITGDINSGVNAWESIKLVVSSGIWHEFRITLHPSLLPPQSVSKIVADLRQLGAKYVVVTPCRAGITLDATLQAIPDMNAYQLGALVL